MRIIFYCKFFQGRFKKGIMLKQKTEFFCDDIHMHICMYVYVCMYVGMYVCMYVCMYVGR